MPVRGCGPVPVRGLWAVSVRAVDSMRAVDSVSEGCE